MGNGELNGEVGVEDLMAHVDYDRVHAFKKKQNNLIYFNFEKYNYVSI